MKVNNISYADPNAPANYVMDRACVTFDGRASTFAVLKSFNVSSINHFQTGNYTTYFSNHFEDSIYAAQIAATRNNSATVHSEKGTTNSLQFVGSNMCQIYTYDNDTNTRQDVFKGYLTIQK